MGVVVKNVKVDSSGIKGFDGVLETAMRMYRESLCQEEARSMAEDIGRMADEMAGLVRLCMSYASVNAQVEYEVDVHVKEGGRILWLTQMMAAPSAALSRLVAPLLSVLLRQGCLFQTGPL